MKQQPVILMGASVRSLAQAAVADGMIPFCVDMFGDRDLQFCVDGVGECRTIHTFAEAADVVGDLPADVPVIVVGGGELSAELLVNLRQRLLAGLSCTRWRSPEKLFPLLQKAGCAVPRWSLTSDSIDPRVEQWLVKQVDSSGGLGVTRWSGGAESATGSLAGRYLQEQLTGPVFSCTWYSPPESRQPVFVGIALQLSGVAPLHATGFHFCGNVGVTEPSPQLLTTLQPAASALHNSAGLLGFWGMDCVLHQGVPQVIEVNGRITASHEIHTSVGGPGVVQSQLAAFGAAPTAAVTFRSSPMLRLVVYAPRQLAISRQLSDRLFSFCHAGGPRESFWLADIPNPGATVPAQTPLCSVCFADIDRVSSADLQTLTDVLPPGCWQIAAEWMHKYQEQIDRLQRL